MKKEEIISKIKRVVERFKALDRKKCIAIAVCLIVLIGVGRYYFYIKKGAQYGGIPVNATVVEVKKEQIVNPKSYVALIEAINSVDVVAKVSGSLDKVNFVEGSDVKKDDVLFVIDSEPYQASYNLAQAQLESANANLTKTKRDYDRQKQLSAKKIASKATFDTAESAYLQAEAAVSQAKARLELARIDLDNTKVKAYIDGVIGKTKVTVGNFVNASVEPLARVVQIDPIRVAFSLTDKEFLDLQKIGKQNVEDYDINIELASGEVLKQKLSKIFANNEVNMGTATIAVYADVNNEQRLLRPGSYVRVFITSSKPKEEIVIPEQAIIQNEGNSLVFVVGEDNIAKMRLVQIGESYDGKQVILSGLSAGEKIMTSGLANRMLRDGAQINIVNAN